MSAPLDTPQLVRDAQIRLWLYKIAKNVLNDYWRKKRVIALSWEDLTAKDVLPDIPGPEDGAERTELIKIALTRLPPKLRLCLLLYSLHGFSSSETARAVGIKEASVGTYISLARKQLRTIYHHLENENVIEKLISI